MFSGMLIYHIVITDYADELIKYAHAFGVPKDVETTIQGMKSSCP